MNDEGTNAQLAGMLAATHTQWSAATNGSQSAAALEIASGTSVMAVGGWSGDPVPTLQQFIDDVHAGRISYYVEAGRGVGLADFASTPAGQEPRAGGALAFHVLDVMEALLSSAHTGAAVTITSTCERPPPVHLRPRYSDKQDGTPP